MSVVHKKRMSESDNREIPATLDAAKEKDDRVGDLRGDSDPSGRISWTISVLFSVCTIRCVSTGHGVAR
eukprot:1412393-Rhodomonas_salina.2